MTTDQASIGVPPQLEAIRPKGTTSLVSASLICCKDLDSGHINKLLKKKSLLPSKKKTNGGHAAKFLFIRRLCPSLGELHVSVAIGGCRDPVCHHGEPDGWEAGRGLDLLGGVHDVAHGLLHVALTGAEPDVADEEVVENQLAVKASKWQTIPLLLRGNSTCQKPSADTVAEWKLFCSRSFLPEQLKLASTLPMAS